jgi:hypothetical protein
MCLGSTKTPAAATPAPAPIRTESIDTTASAAQTSEALRRRQRLAAMSRSDTRAGGAMQGQEAGAGGKTKTGE